jgi:DNA-binding NarL/FixJ family response regulator
MPKDISGHKRDTPAVAVDPADRLFDLLSTFSTLRSDGQVLVDQIRGSVHKMRQLRSQLRGQHDALPHPDGNGAHGTDHDRAHLQTRYGLTRREVQVAVLLAQGRSNSRIAQDLRISAHTARHHTQRILSKLEVHSRGEAGAKIRG